ncbi:MAG: hypothetical protein E6F96_12720 [Actinobacteria bacterium]|nr:MAG: hypothetical protein E6F96_12720 [Actinomycetota bacterium]
MARTRASSREARRAYGLQFHLEASAQLARTWLEVPAYAAEATQALGPAARAVLAGDLGALDRTTPLARELFGRWIERALSVASA